MKIIAFNVNGIRAILKKDLAKSIATLVPDVLVIEETKLSEELHIDFPFVPEGYTAYWTCSKLRKGYSGVAILSKVNLLRSLTVSKMRNTTMKAASSLWSSPPSI